ncbi:MAG: hypothetical protein ABL888_09975 [Pirellulaceae bacterium]
MFRKVWLGSLLVVLAGLHSTIGLPAVLAQEQQEKVAIPDSPSRKWSSSDGRFSVEGSLIEATGDKIRIQSNDRVVTAPLNRLTDADQKFVKDEIERAKTEAENPFMEEGETPEKDPFVDDSDSPSNSAGSNVDPDYTRAEGVLLDSDTQVDLSAKHWQPQTRKPISKFRVPAFSWHSRIGGSVSNISESLFAISLHEPFGVDLKGGKQHRPGATGGVKSWVELVDLPSGKSRGRFPLPAEHSVVGDLSEDAKRVLTYDGTFAQNPQLRLLKIGDRKLNLVSSAQSKGSDGRQQAANSAKFLADNKILVEFSGQLIVFDGSTWEPLWTIANDASDWQLASDRRHAMVGQSGRRYEVDLLAGKCTGVVGKPGAVTAEGVAEPNGERIVSIKDSVLMLRNHQGEIIDEFQIPVFWPNATLAWLENDFIRVNSPHQTHFIDLKHRIVLIEISNAGSTSSNSAWSAEKVNQGQDHFVLVTQVAEQQHLAPDLEAYRKRIKADAESLLILKKGDKVSLSIQLGAHPEHADLVEQRLTAILTARGVEIDDSATAQIRVKSSERNEEVSYRRFGAPPWDADAIEKVQVRSVNQSIEYALGGQVVWRQGSASGPGFMLHMKEGESAQQAVDRQTGDGTHFWNSLKLPRNVARHPNGQAWFRLTKTDKGYVEQK